MWRKRVKTPGTSFLTAQQLRFADEHGASAGMEAQGGVGVFFYQEEGNWVNRWLVGAEGNIREQVQFRTHAAWAPASGRGATARRAAESPSGAADRYCISA